MFDYIKGTLVRLRAQTATIEVQGIAYLVHISVRQARGWEEGKKILAYVSAQFREPTWTLYGFAKEEERELFETLLGVSGIGPKLALAMMGHLSLEDFYEVIQEQNPQRLCLVPGVGKRTAERLFVEIKGKISPLDMQLKLQKDAFIPEDQTVQDALGALVSLGYKSSEAKQALERVLKNVDKNKKLSSSELVTQAMQDKFS